MAKNIKRITTAGDLQDMLAKVPREAKVFVTGDPLAQYVDPVNDCFPSYIHPEDNNIVELFSKTKPSAKTNSVLIFLR